MTEEWRDIPVPAITCVSDLQAALRDMPPEAEVVDSWGALVQSVHLDEDGDVVLGDEG